MTSSPTPAERLAIKTANAAVLNSPDSMCDIVATVVFALGSAQLLQSPEHAAEVAQLSTDLDGARLSLWEEEQDSKRARFAARLARQRAAKLRARVAELEAGTAAVLSLHTKYEDSEHCQHDGERWPCPTVQATPFTAAELAQGAADAAFLAEVRPVDEDPIAYALTPEALHASSGAVIEIPDRPRDGVYRQGTAHRQQMRDLIAGQRAALGNHDGPPHHDYTIGRDLPEVTP
jgi:hypothetical protein